jgi:hypothetical protein
MKQYRTLGMGTIWRIDESVFQMVECLPQKHKALSSNPNYPKEN